MPFGGTFSSCDQLPIHPRDSFLDPGYSTSVRKYAECPPPLGSVIMAIPTKKQHNASKQQAHQQPGESSKAVATDFWIQLASQLAV